MANNTGTFPIPMGVGWSLSNVQPGVNTPAQGLDAGFAIATFSPVDVNNPGTASFYQTGVTNAILTFNAGGYGEFIAVAGATYYFNCTSGAAVVAATRPNSSTRLM